MFQTIDNKKKVSHRDVRVFAHSISVGIFQFLNVTSVWFSLTTVCLAAVVLSKRTKASFTNVVAPKWAGEDCKHFVLADLVRLDCR